MTLNTFITTMEPVDDNPDDNLSSLMYQDLEDSMTESIGGGLLVPFLDGPRHRQITVPHTRPDDHRLHNDRAFSIDECSTLTSAGNNTESNQNSFIPSVSFRGHGEHGNTFGGSTTTWSEFRNYSFGDQHSLGSPTLIQDAATMIPDLYTGENHWSDPNQASMPLSDKLAEMSLQCRPPDNQAQQVLLGQFSNLTIDSRTQEGRPNSREESEVIQRLKPAVQNEHEEPRRLYVGRGVQLDQQSITHRSPVKVTQKLTNDEQNCRTDNSVCSSHATSEEASHWCPCLSVEASQKEINEEMLNLQDDDGDTLLHTAIIQELFDVVLTILYSASCYSVLNLTNNLMQTPLHLAVLTHQPRLVRLLMSRGSRLDARDRHGNTALHLACKTGCLACAKELTRPINQAEISLCKYQVPFQRVPQDPSMLNYDGQSYVHLAADSNNLDLLDYLVSPAVGYSINAHHARTGRTVLHDAACRADGTLLRHLLRNVPSLDVNVEAFDGMTPLQLALNNDDRDSIRLLRPAPVREHAMDTE